MTFKPPARTVPIDRRNPVINLAADIPPLLDWLRGYYPNHTAIGIHVYAKDTGLTYRVDTESAYAQFVQAGPFGTYTLTAQATQAGVNTTVNTTVRSRGPLYAPDAIAGLADPAAILNALNALHLQGYQTSRAIYYPAGTYSIGPGGLLYYPGQDISGDGAATIIKAAGINQSGAMLRTATVAGVPKADSSLRNLKLDQNSTANDGNSPTLSIEGTLRFRTENVIWDNVATMMLHCDSREPNPTVGAIILNPTLLKSQGGGLSTFGAHYDFQYIGGTFNNYGDDAIAIQDVTATNTQPRGHIASGTMTFRNGNRRRAIGNALSTPHALLIYGAKDINWGAIIDADGASVAATVSIQAGAQYRASNVQLGKVNIRNAARTPDSTTGVSSGGVSVLQADQVYLAGGVIKNSRGAGIQVVSSTVTMGHFDSTENDDQGLYAASATIELTSGGRFNNNGQVVSTGRNHGIYSADSTISSAIPIEASDNQATKTQQYGVYAAGSSVFSHNGIKAIGNYGAPVAVGTGSVVTAGKVMTTIGGLFEDSGQTTIVINSANSPTITHRLGEAPRFYSITPRDGAAITVAPQTASTFILVRAGPQTAATVVDWKVEL